MSSPEIGTPADPAAQPSAPQPTATRSRFRKSKSAAAPESAPAQALPVQPVSAPVYEAPAPIQPMPETFYSQESIQQPALASRTAYLHNAPPNYPAAAPYQPSPAHQAAPAYVSQSATQAWPAIENTLPRTEAPGLSAEDAAAIAAAITAANKQQHRFRLHMPKVRMPKLRMPKFSMARVKQSVPQVNTRKIAWKRIGVASAALLALMLTIPTIYVVADRAPREAVVEAPAVVEAAPAVVEAAPAVVVDPAAAVAAPEKSALRTLRDKVWNLATLGRGGVKADQQAMEVVALSINPPVPGSVEASALQAAYAASIAAAEARLAAGEVVVADLAPGTVIRTVTLKPFVAGEPVVAAQPALIVAGQPEQVAMSAPAVTNVEAVPLVAPCRVMHTVRRGEGLFTIADAYGVERRQVYRANTWVRNRANMYLYVGDQVCIP